MTRVWQSIDPSNGEPFAEWPLHTAAEVEAALAEAWRAFEVWRARPLEERCAWLRELAEHLEARAEALALVAVREMGKPRSQAVGEVRKCAWALRYAAERAPEWLAPRCVVTERRSYVRFDPLGPILAIMPWNFPYWQVIRFAASTWAAGNVVLLKHAPTTQGVAEALVELVAATTDLPLLQNLRVEVDTIPELIADRRVRGVTLTGSTRAGRAVAAAAGNALKPVVLELGGSDPYLVLADADLEATARTCVAARLNNSGQTCIAAKRWIVVAEVYDRFAELVTQQLAAVTWGPPLAEPEPTIGPLARRDLRDTLHAQVQASVAAGADLRLGGTIPEGPGFFYPPTLLAEVRPGMPAFDEELFGPVGTLIRARDETEALALANRSSYGLGGAIFTRDRRHAEALAAYLEVGAVAINGAVHSDPRLPFGGIKDSGFGRELGLEGMHSFVNVKSVVVG